MKQPQEHINLEALQAELEELRIQLSEANDTIEAIRTGQIDALVVSGNNGHELYTLKTADQSYRVFIENMTEGALTLNRDGIILYCNNQFATLIKTPISEVIGNAFENLILEDEKKHFKDLINHSWAKDGKDETILVDLEKNTIPVLLSLSKLSFDEEEALSILVTDLSFQKRTQKQLEENNNSLAEMNQQLELTNHDLQQFASVASHDLQEPLRKVEIFSSRLKEKAKDLLTDDHKIYLDKIIDASRRMKLLIVDVLNYSRLSANNNVFELVDLNIMMKELLSDFELMILDKKASFHISPLPVVEGNKGQLRQVFQNIISNALKFSVPQQAPVIEIRSTTLAEKSFDSVEKKNGAYSLISIKDNGIGFDEKYLENIFTLFERLHTKDDYEGTGIGMAIAKKIIDKHNGLVSARSTPGKGAEFLFLLPVIQNK